MSSKRIPGRAVAASAFALSAVLAGTEAPECVHETDKPVKVALKGNTTHLKVEKMTR